MMLHTKGAYKTVGVFLNSKSPYESYRLVRKSPYYVDKTALLGELIPSLGVENRFFCITRPRRFGKSVIANMIAAFLGKAEDAEELFSGLEIMSDPDCAPHRNQYNVIFIDFSEVSRDCTSFEQYIERIQNGINADLAEAYPELGIDPTAAVWDVLNDIFRKKKESFVFVMDEWDAVFHMSFIKKEEQASFLLFLKSLLKGRVYVKLAYMTGILPIAKYSGGSELNMFAEYDMATKIRFGSYFGFLDEEVDWLYGIYLKKTRNPRITREELADWYDGYHTAAGCRMYNPRSVICALQDNQISNYWTSSGPYDEIFYYIKNDIDHIRDDLALMISGESIRIKLQGYAAVQSQLLTKNQIYSAMVVYGLLTYEDGAVMIPNRELMDKFEELLLTNDSLGYVYNLAKESDRMLEATLVGDTETMAKILEYAHNTESPIFAYNHETELSAVVNLVYLAARDRYRVEREDKAGKGYVDFIFYPVRKADAALILELKVNHTPEEAIAQIKAKDYPVRLSGRLGEQQKFTGRILLVGISYNTKTKSHACKVEEFMQG